MQKSSLRPGTKVRIINNNKYYSMSLRWKRDGKLPCIEVLSAE